MAVQGYKAKRVLGLCCSWSGLAMARWRFLPPAIYVLNYHRVGNSKATAFDRGTFTCTAERFRLHLEMLCERVDVINLEQLHRIVAKGALPGRKAVAVITFDDGYADNHSIAFPLLKEFGVTAAFFLPTAFINTAYIPWWDEIAWHVRHSIRPQLALPGMVRPLSLVHADRDVAVRTVLQWARRQHLPIAEKLQVVREATGTGEAPQAEKDALFMSWTQVRELALAGMDIGSHTHSHNILSHLPRDAQIHELVDSRRVLEGELGIQVNAVAYPVGDETCFTSQTLELSRLAGYQLGFNYFGRVQQVPIADPLNVNRIKVDDHALPNSTFRQQVAFPNLAFD